MTIRVCLAGATGWAGSELSRGISGADGIRLVAAVSRRAAGRTLNAVLGESVAACPVYATAAEALAHPCDVFFEYTSAGAARAHVLAAVERRVPVVIGTSGLTPADFDEIGEAARRHEVGVLAVGNFSLTAALLLKLSEIVARFVPQWEIIDYAREDKVDAPSGTAQELATRLARVRSQAPNVPLERTVGRPESRGATVDGTQVHAIRLPGFVLSAEVHFGMKDERLTLRHDAGSSAQPYVEGALLAIRAVGRLTGLHHGLDAVMDLEFPRH